MNDSTIINPLSPVKNTTSRTRKRGDFCSGYKIKYLNYMFQQHNEIKMLARLKGKVSKEVINEITQVIIKVA
jgi:hypothetical protein